MTLQGGCACGSVRYNLLCDGMPPVACCHCLDCQTRSGSAFDQTAFVPSREFVLTGNLASRTHEAPSGSVMTSNFCPACHTEIFNVHPGLCDRILLRAGTLDESQQIVPFAHLFTKRMQPWLQISDGTPAFSDFPDADFFKLFTRVRKHAQGSAEL